MNKPVEEQILNEMEVQKISMNRLSAMVFISRVHLTRCLKKISGEKRSLTDEVKKKIEAALGKEFTITNP